MMAWLLDVLVGLVVTGMELGALALYWFLRGLKVWAAKGRPVPERKNRDIALYTSVAALSAAVAYGSFRASLPVTAVLQALPFSFMVLGMLAVIRKVVQHRREMSRLRKRYKAWKNTPLLPDHRALPRPYASAPPPRPGRPS
ncbi:DUF6234 family protein [Streptomyces sp. NPDC049837]|uniref:DUF6234 family protein n=1 Tax=Streptomyces sp. NPDC049837 TaxID=3155277 RepID=UPI00344839B6